MPETIFVGLYPVVFLAVDIDALDTALDASLGQYALRMAVGQFRPRIKGGIVHALTKPQTAIGSLIDFVNVVITQCHGILQD